MSVGKRNPSLALDMSFGEALERFAGVDPRELELPERPRRDADQPEGPTVLQWRKILSKTDAQQETTGGLVPYLRLTKSNLTTEDFQTWFRADFFAGAAWVPGMLGKENVEQAYVPFAVTVNDLNIGTEALLVTHGEHRRESNNAPNTWLHWSANLQNLLDLNDFSGHPVSLTRDDSGVYHLDINAAADA